jgi:HEAT repeat protein
MSTLSGCEVFNPVTPAAATQLMENKYYPDARREGIAALATRWDFTHHPPYTTRFQQIAQHDPDYVVKAMAIRALNIARDPTATKIFIAGLSDPNDLVRLESVKALANVPDAEAIPLLIARLQGSREMVIEGREITVAEDKDIRIAAADALRRYRTLDVAHTLVRFLNEGDFGIAWQSRQSLIAMTGQDMQYDENAWLQLLVGPGKPLG